MKNDSSKKKTSLSDNKNEETCKWHINSPEHSNCFWIYVYSLSYPDGSMPEHTQSKISKLMGIPSTKIPNLLKQAMLELNEAMNMRKIKQLMIGGRIFTVSELNAALGSKSNKALIEEDPGIIVEPPGFEVFIKYGNKDYND